jgi:alanine-synthesizing transaminase
MFPKLDPAVFKIDNDVSLIMDILEQEQVLLVQGSAFNIDDTQHLRIVFLPRVDELIPAIAGIARVLEKYRI